MSNFNAYRLESTELLSRTKWNGLIGFLDERFPNNPNNDVAGVLNVTSPNNKGQLHLRSTETGDSFISNLDNAGNNQSIDNRDLTIQAQGQLRVATADSSGQPQQRLIIDQEGRMGLGATAFSPQRPLHLRANGAVLGIEGDDHAYAEFYPDGFAGERTTQLGFLTASTHTFTIRQAGKGHLEMTTGKGKLRIEEEGRLELRAASGGLTITPEGKVGIGLEEAAHPLHVNGKIAGSGLEISGDGQFDDTLRAPLYASFEDSKGTVIETRPELAPGTNPNDPPAVQKRRLSFGWALEGENLYLRFYIDDQRVLQLEANP